MCILDGSNWPGYLIQEISRHRYLIWFSLSASSAKDGNLSLCLSVCLSICLGVFLSLPRLLSFSTTSVCLTQLIIQMSTARSLPSKGVAGIFSTVPFLFVMWNQSPEMQQRYPQLTPHTAALPIKERSTTTARSSWLIGKKKSDLNHHLCHCCPTSFYVHLCVWWSVKISIIIHIKPQ